MDTYDPVFFQRLKQVEKKHFWFRIRRKWIFDRIRRFVPPPADLLEVGCGCGNVCSYMSQRGYISKGCEYFPDAVKTAYPDFQMVQGDARTLPFRDRSFDVVGLFDVIEHFENDRDILIEARRMIRPGGIVAPTVPARKELWSHFDEISCHKRRYSRDDVYTILTDIRLKPLSVEHMFLPLYWAAKLRKNKKSNDYFRINPVVNEVFALMLEIERTITKLVKMPIGTSIIAIGCLEK